jgi:putative DNA primase/helicase
MSAKKKTVEVPEGEAKSLPEVEGCPVVPGFQWEPGGLFHKAEKRNELSETVEVLEWIAPPFTLPGLVRNGEYSEWGFLMAWDDLDRVHHEELIHNEDLAGDGLEIFRTLARGGLVLPPNPKSRKLLLEFLTRAVIKTKNRVRTVDTLGWIEDGQAFVMPDGSVIGTSTETLRYAGERRHVPTAKGTLEGWQKGVASMAVGNPRLAFSISVAFTGPLLPIVRPDGGGGFNLQGSSSKGKSTCLESASSVWCNPDPLPQWRATSNGLEGICAAHNHGFMALDELSQMDPKEVGQSAYLIANGRDKARMTKNGDARPAKTWLVCFLSSGEQTLEDKLNEDGKVIRAGHEVRVVDIPCGTEGLFQDAHGMPSMAHFAEHLKAQARQHYGHAASAFIKNLCDGWQERAALAAQLREDEQAWLAAEVPPGVDGQVRRVAGRFALVAIAGELAAKQGVLPWPRGVASKAAAVCFQAWLTKRGHNGASERERGLQAVVDFLALHGLARFAEWHTPDARPFNMAGVRREASPFGWDFYFSPTGWKEATRGYDAREVSRNAILDGLLEAGEQGEPYQKQRTPHGQGRWYVIRATALGTFREVTL